MSSRFFTGTILVTVGLITAGCATSKIERIGAPTGETIGFWQPHLLYLQPSPHPRLYVEIDAVEGCEPNEATLNKIREFLTAYCKKPGGIEIVRSDVIPIKEAQGMPRYRLAHKFLSGPSERAGDPPPAFMYMLFYDGALCDQPAASESDQRNAPRQAKESEHDRNPYTEWLPYPAIFFMNTRYGPPFGVGWGNAPLHETGHLLGLVRRPNSQGHCPDSACRMTRTLSLHRYVLGRMGSLFGVTPNKQGQLCTNCLNELTANWTAPSPTNLHFVGPVLVRSEAGYHVLSLPGRMRLIVGDLVVQDCRDLAADARGKLLPSNNAISTDGQIKPELLRKPEKAAEIIERAKGDPYDAVRRQASRFEESAIP